MPELTDTHMELMVLDTTDTLLELTTSARDLLRLKLSQKLGMALMDMDILVTHTATDTPDTHTVMPDTHTLTDTESRLVKYQEIFNTFLQSIFCVNKTFCNCNT